MNKNITINYQTGFRNHFATEAKSGTLPAKQNSPQQPAMGLYAEQLSGSAFTAIKPHNLRSWLYRILPSVKHGDFTTIDRNMIRCPKDNSHLVPPNQCRWDPLPLAKKKLDFIDSWHSFASHGSIANRMGAAIHLYACNQSMNNRFFYDADGELLVVAEQGELLFRTELGLLTLSPREILVIPRGVIFQVDMITDHARGYICENFGAPFDLPYRGPIGSNGLANERDFHYPVAYFENKAADYVIDNKFFGHLWRARLDHSPLNVLAWHGNYAPYKYNLLNFNTINTVSFDHPDPSIFTVLTSVSQTPGVANVDFVIFPQRWMVAEHTFRPPYYHRNTMSEFMGLIYGDYDAKQQGFVPGGSSLHNCMSPHGPDITAHQQASEETLKPIYYDNTLAFMFESHSVWQPTEFALNTKLRQKDYMQCWADLPINFTE